MEGKDGSEEDGAVGFPNFFSKLLVKISNFYSSVIKRR